MAREPFREFVDSLDIEWEPEDDPPVEILVGSDRPKMHRWLAFVVVIQALIIAAKVVARNVVYMVKVVRGGVVNYE